MGANGRTKRTDTAAVQSRLNWRLVMRWLSLVSVLMLVGGAAAWSVITLRDPAVLPLKIVRIDGDFKNLDRRTLEQAVSQAIVGNFFTVDLDRIRAEALKLAWVDQVTVRRIWPGTLNMWVEEQKPLARWGGNQLVNDRGGVFTPEAESIKKDLPWLEGPTEHAVEVVNQFKQLGGRFASLGLVITKLAMDGRGSWTIDLVQGIELKLGNKNTAGRIERFVQLYPRLEQNEKHKIKRVDMRYANGVAVLWGDAS
jgi:cell division protein FtsQ